MAFALTGFSETQQNLANVGFRSSTQPTFLGVISCPVASFVYKIKFQLKETLLPSPPGRG